MFRGRRLPEPAISGRLTLGSPAASSCGGVLMRQDLRFALRILARRPAVTAMALILLALGIGANTALFTLIQSILFRPLPGIRDPGRLVRFLRIENGQTSGNFGYPDYLDYRNQTRLLSGVAAEATTSLSFANGKTERISGAAGSGNYFS